MSYQKQSYRDKQASATADLLAVIFTEALHLPSPATVGLERREDGGFVVFVKWIDRENKARRISHWFCYEEISSGSYSTTNLFRQACNTARDMMYAELEKTK